MEKSKKALLLLWERADGGALSDWDRNCADYLEGGLKCGRWSRV
jgi:hypothetical protein